MAKSATIYACQDCGATYGKWMGRCEACGVWNKIVAESSAVVPKGLSKGSGHLVTFESLESTKEPLLRIQSHLQEFDRVCGGGLVAGAVLLVGGDPGIGKSTVLLQVASFLASQFPTAYTSGEEGVEQIRLRAHRLGVEKAPLHLASTAHVRDILHTLKENKMIRAVVIDSIQTMYIDNIDAAPGTVSQVRACAHELIRYAKANQCILVLVGHVTKDGAIAGPKVLEHMVDTVLYFEGERGHQFRILRTVKNRFGPTDEIGVFEMTDKGLVEVTNPSALFLNSQNTQISGSCVFAGVEGTRPLLVEIQALVASTSYATPKRSAVGWDTNRLGMILAVLEARCGISFSGKDVYLNVAGGLKIMEPAVDAAVATAILSALLNQVMPEKTVIFGEVGLSGELRSVNQTPARLKEAAKLGFQEVWMPQATGRALDAQGIALKECAHLSDIVDLLVSQKQRLKQQGSRS